MRKRVGASNRQPVLSRRVIALALSLCFLTSSAAYGNIPYSESPPQVNQTLIIHLQDAHGNPEAQRSLARIIQRLVKEYGIKTVFVEGAVENLDPERLRFIPDAKLNRKLIDRLVEQGEITGVELAMLEQEPAHRFRAVGIEEAGLYRENFELFREVMRSEPAARKFIAEAQKKLDRRASRVLDKELLVLFRHYLELEKSRTNLTTLLGYLDRLLGRRLGRDLRSSREQFEFPNLVRLYRLKDEEGKIDLEKASREEKDIRARYGNFGSLTGPANPRHVLEQLYRKASPLGFQFESYPHFTQAARNCVYQYEITPASLFEEIIRLMEAFFAAMAKSQDARQIIREAKEFKLTRSLLTLELTRGEYENILESAKSPLERGVAEGDGVCKGDNTPRRFAPPLSRGDNTPRSLRIPLQFYEKAVARESVFMKKIGEEISRSKETRAILVTGGFHTEGLNKYFDANKISHLTLRPKVESASREIYHQSMMRAPEHSEIVLALLAQSRPALAASLGKEAFQERMKVIQSEAKSLGEFAVPEDPESFLDSLDADGFKRLLDQATQILEQSHPDLERPLDFWGQPGSLLILKKGEILVPIGDLHGRFDHLAALLKEPGILEGLKSERLQLVFLGDLFQPSFYLPRTPPEVMDRAIAALALLLELKLAFPRNVHVLMGNHDYSHVDEGGFAKRASLLHDLRLKFEGGLGRRYKREAGKEISEKLSHFVSLWPLMIKARVGTDEVLMLHARPPHFENPNLLVKVFQLGKDAVDNPALYQLLSSRDYGARRIRAFLEKNNLAALFSGHTIPNLGNAVECGFQSFHNGHYGIVDANLILDFQWGRELVYPMIDMTKPLPRDKRGHVDLRKLKDPAGNCAFHVIRVSEARSLGASPEGEPRRRPGLDRIRSAFRALPGVLGEAAWRFSSLFYIPREINPGEALPHLRLKRRKGTEQVSVVNPQGQREKVPISQVILEAEKGPSCAYRFYFRGTWLVIRRKSVWEREQLAILRLTRHEVKNRIVNIFFFGQHLLSVVKMEFLQDEMREFEVKMKTARDTYGEYQRLVGDEKITASGYVEKSQECLEVLRPLLEMARRISNMEENETNREFLRQVQGIARAVLEDGNTFEIFLRLMGEEEKLSRRSSGPVSVRDVVATTQTLYKRLFYKTQVVNLIPEGTLADVSSRALVAIFGNLIRNAARHGAQQVIFESTVDETSGEIHLRVRNNGAMIPPEDRERLFELGFSTRAKRDPDEESGVGLHWTREYARLRGGGAFVESSDADWTVFKIDIPAAQGRSLGSAVLVAEKVTSKVIDLRDLKIWPDLRLRISLERDTQSKRLTADDLLTYLAAHGIHVPATPEEPFTAVLTRQFIEEADENRALDLIRNLREGDRIGLLVDSKIKMSDDTPLTRRLAEIYRLAHLRKITLVPFDSSWLLGTHGLSLETIGGIPRLDRIGEENFSRFAFDEKELKGKTLDLELIFSTLMLLATLPKDKRRQAYEALGLSERGPLWVIGGHVAEFLKKLESEMMGHKEFAHAA